MPSKAKRDKVPKSRHHPSQSSVDVPLRVKEDVKRLQDNRCWLCDCKAHKKLRPLEICHVFPQATSRRSRFVNHHKFGRTQLHNIHDTANLVALCSICHFAFDNDEWTFIPEDTTIWTQRIEATPQIIPEYNSQRNIVFRRLLLQLDPDSKAFQDNHYKSAFTNSPTKIWSGEPGVVMVRPPVNPPPEPTAELQKTWDDFGALQKLWLACKSPCSKEKCPICQPNNDGKQGKGDDLDDKDEGKDADEGNEDAEEGNEDAEEDEEDEEDDEDEDDEGNEEDSEEDSEEDEEGDENISSSTKSTKGSSKTQPDSTGQQQPPLQDPDTKNPIQTKKHRKKPKHAERDWMTSAPYDESVPYSHRYGYTWADSTSNSLMQMWQAYRKPVDS
ncbi:hypothetical protein MMC24_001304 [Lignoscripta atroalba]|nr:hypothetical protein [Lignoscripta atroalba]